MNNFKECSEIAERRIREIFDPTPCVKNDFLSNIYEAEVWLKREDLTPVRSYKIRGAWNAMNKLRDVDASADLFVCASAGNHAQGVAFACRELGVRGVIFMPVTTPQQKIDKTRVFGGDQIEIKLVGDYFDDTLSAAKSYCTEADGYFLAPFDDEDVIEGQSTVAVEFIRQMGNPDIVILPVGGGGLSSGTVSYLKEVSPNTEIYFIEPAGARSMREAIYHKKPVQLAHVDSFVDGAAVAVLGKRTFEKLADQPLDHVLSCPEDRICVTIIDMLNAEGIVLEPAGALSIDAMRDLTHIIKGKRVLCIASGGNFDFERLPEVKERAQRFMGVKKYFILRMPQRPGALRDFLDLLGPQDNISRFEYLKKSARNFGSVLIGIETNDPKNFEAVFKNMDDAGLTYVDITNDQSLAEFIL